MATLRALKDPAGAVRGYKVRYRTPAGARSKTFPKGQKEAAKAYAVKVESDKITGTALDPAGARTTVENYAEAQAEIALCRASSAKRHAASLALFVEMFGARPLAKVRHSDIRAWVKARGGEVSARTLRTELGTVRALFAAAVADRLIGSSPCDGVTVASAPRRERTAIERAGVEAIAARLPAHWGRLAPITARTGLRPAEVLGLTVPQIDFLRRELTVDRQRRQDGRVVLEVKTPTSRRTIPLDDGTLELLAAQIAEHPAGVKAPIFDDRGEVVGYAPLVFHTGAGAALSHRALNATWKRHATAAGFEGVRVHDMRHFFASALIRAGASVVLVSQLLGHASPAITADIYAHEFEDRDERARSLVASVWEPAAELEAAAR
jgi:integrase